MSGNRTVESLGQVPRVGVAAGITGQSGLATRDVAYFEAGLGLGARRGPIMRTIEAVDGWLIEISRRFKRPS